jgi:23S rRNA (uracil1939-C5)-methyltransferase
MSAPREPDPAAGLPERELAVESVAVGGDGVAREESGRVVFVPRTAPGDRVRARITEDQGSYARAEVTEILEAGPRRREPPCRHYDEGCGGCQLQHLEMEAQRAAKRKMVRDTLRRIGDREAEVEETVPSDRPLGYRNRVRLTLRREEDGVRAGYHRRGAPGRIVDVEECPLAEDAVNRAWRQLRRGWGEGARHLPAGASLRVTIRASAPGRVTILVEGEDEPGRAGDGGGAAPRSRAAGPPPPGAGPPDDPGRVRPEGSPEAVAAAVDGLSGYFWRPRDGERRRLAGEPRMVEEWQGVELRLPPEVFLQVNRGAAREMEAYLDRRIGERLGGPRDRRILDLYAGVGTRALRWAEAGAEVAGAEVDAEAVATGREAAERRGVETGLRVRSVESCLPELLPADLAVVNPPRTGLSGEAASLLADASLEELAYVSCDPATLARDLARLGEGWEIDSIRPFDAFPQTAHVETIAWLRRGPGRAGGAGRTSEQREGRAG